MRTAPMAFTVSTEVNFRPQFAFAAAIAAWLVES